MHSKCNALESSPNNPPLPICGKIVFHKTGPWCQKRWGSLMYRISLAVQWLRLCASIAGGTGSIPGWEIKISHAAWCK